MNVNDYEWIAQECPICEAPPTSFLGRRGGSAHRGGLGVECEIWQCGNCRLIFPNPMPVPTRGLSQHYEVSGDEYFRHHELEQKREAAREQLRQAATVGPKGGRLLDIGAGRGEFVSVAKEEGWEPVGIEPSESFASFAESFAGVPMYRTELKDCNFPDSSFDAVILGAVLEHLYNPDETVKEISRILKRGGLLFVDVPNEEGLYFRVGNLYQKIRGRKWVVNLAPTFSPFHVFGYGAKSLRALLAKYELSPRIWRVYGGTSYVPTRGGLVGEVEKMGAKAVTAISNLGHLGTYIETWAVKN